MNLNEIKVIIADMQRLKRAQQAAKDNLIKFLCGTNEVYKEVSTVFEGGFSLDGFKWRQSLEDHYGDAWTTVFACVGEDPTGDRILENLFTLTEKDPQIYAIMLSEYDSRVIEKKIEAAEFVANYQFPTNHHEWIARRINKKNPALSIDVQLFEKVDRQLSNIYRNVIDYAIDKRSANWKGELEFDERFKDSYGVMIKDLIPPCIELSDRYMNTLAWMDEYRNQRDGKIGTSMTMEELDNLCSSDK